MTTPIIDPVCGMEVKPQHYETLYLGTSYAFCSAQCQQRFLADPHRYVAVTQTGQPESAKPEEGGNKAHQ